MRAQILRSPKPAEEKPLELEDRPKPSPGGGEVLLRVRHCGVCRTDLHIAEGDLEPRKDELVPGHQIVAEIAEVGPEVEKYQGGERVGVTWLYSSCGKCPCCEAEQENLCDNIRFTGYTDDGGYAEYCVVPAPWVHPLPEGLEDAQAAPLLCAGVIGWRTLKLAKAEPGKRVGLIGFGASAHLVIQVLTHWDCKVAVITRSENHQRHARELGADWVGGPGEKPPYELDSVAIFAPAGKVVPEALGLLRKGGVCAINAVHMSPIPEMDYDLIYHERTLRSVANVTREDAREFLPLAAEIPIRTNVEIFDLEEANRALLKLKNSEINGAAVLRVAGE